MDENSRPSKRKRRTTGQKSPESPRRTQRVPDWDPFGKGESRSIPQSVGTSSYLESIPRRDPIASHNPKEQRIAHRPVSAAMGSLEQGFDAQPIDEQIPVWDPFKDNVNEDDPAHDPFIAKMREEFESQNERNKRKKKKNKKKKKLSDDYPYIRAHKRNLEDIQRNFHEEHDKTKRKKQVLRSQGFREKDHRYIQREGVHQNFDVSQRKSLFPQRRRSLDQIRSEAIKQRKRRRPLTRLLNDPLAERSRRLLARSQSTMAQVTNRNPEFYRKQKRRKQKKDMWRHLQQRQVYRRSPYKVFDQNRRVVNLGLGAKRNELSKGNTRAIRWAPQHSNVVPILPKKLKKIREKTEPTPTDRPYFPEKFVGYPSRMRQNIESRPRQIYSSSDSIGSDRKTSLPHTPHSHQIPQSSSWSNHRISSVVTVPQSERSSQKLPNWRRGLYNREMGNLPSLIDTNFDDSPPPTHYETDDDSELE